MDYHAAHNEFTPSIPDASFARSISTYTTQGTAPQYGTLEFGTAAERERASRPRRNLMEQWQRLKAFNAFQQNFQRLQSQLQGTADHPHPELQHEPQPSHSNMYPSIMYPLPNPNVAPGPAPNANYGMANAGFDAGGPQYEHLCKQGIGGNTVVPPPSSDFPQAQMDRWPSGHVIPASHQYGGYAPGPQAMGVAPSYASPAQTALAPTMDVNHQVMVLSEQEQEQATAAPAASGMQGHVSQLPEDINHWPASLSTEQFHAPPPAPSGWPSQMQGHYYGEQSHQGLMLPAASVAADEGILVQGRKRRAVDDDDTRQTKRHRLGPANDPNFEPQVQAIWNCTSVAAAEGNSPHGRKRSAVDDDDMRQTKWARLHPDEW